MIDNDKTKYPGSFEFKWNKRAVALHDVDERLGEPHAIGHLGVHFYRGQEYFPSFRVSMLDGAKTLRNMHEEFEQAWKDGIEMEPVEQ